MSSSGLSRINQDWCSVIWFVSDLERWDTSDIPKSDNRLLAYCSGILSMIEKASSMTLCRQSFVGFHLHCWLWLSRTQFYWGDAFVNEVFLGCELRITGIGLFGATSLKPFGTGMLDSFQQYHRVHQSVHPSWSSVKFPFPRRRPFLQGGLCSGPHLDLK